MRIDPVKVIINFLKSRTEITSLTSDRISPRSLFGSQWSKKDYALVAKLDGGQTDLYVPVLRPRYEFDFYGADEVLAMNLYLTLSKVADDVERVPVFTPDGDALLYFLKEDSAPSILYDQDLEVYYVMAFFHAMIHKEKIE